MTSTTYANPLAQRILSVLKVAPPGDWADRSLLPPPLLVTIDEKAADREAAQAIDEVCEGKWDRYLVYWASSLGRNVRTEREEWGSYLVGRLASAEDEDDDHDVTNAAADRAGDLMDRLQEKLLGDRSLWPEYVAHCASRKSGERENP